ncbi:hypothetical protein GCM10009547_18220 [Sporichthya brevicatena]|uniref:Uncharacterized protein n=1 Tax=Sporichthya brevicatena TaxID=171442 RepID=A0ABN1GR46_9ACTN
MTTVAVGTRAAVRRAADAAPVGGLWARTDLALVVGANAVGLVLIVVGWLGSSDALTLNAGVDWLKVGIVGVIFAGVCNGLFLLRGRRAVGLARRAVLGVPRDRRAVVVEDEVALVARPGSRRVHRPTCPMVAGKPVEAVAAVGDLTPCELCRPGVAG